MHSQPANHVCTYIIATMYTLTNYKVYRGRWRLKFQGDIHISLQKAHHCDLQPVTALVIAIATYTGICVCGKHDTWGQNMYHCDTWVAVFYPLKKPLNWFQQCDSILCTRLSSTLTWGIISKRIPCCSLIGDYYSYCTIPLGTCKVGQVDYQ